MKEWQQKYLDSIDKMSNEDLLVETLDLAAGDDYDGCFTERGRWEYNALSTELEKRLQLVGFLPQRS